MTETEVKSKIKLYIEANIAAIEERRKQPQFSWGELCELAQVDKVFSEKFRQLYRAYLRKYQTSVHKVQNQQPITDDQMAELYKTLTSNQIEFVEDEFKFLQGNENKDKGTKEFIFTAHRIPSEEEIVEHFNIDLKKYRISQIWHKTTPGGKYSISVNLQALKGNETVDINTDFLSKLDLIKPIQLPLPKESSDLPKACLLIAKQDSHWNKYDIDGDNSIQDRFSTFGKAIFNQLEKASKLNNLEKIVYVVGSDEFNSEWTNTTTKGTPQQNILSYQEAFEKVSQFSITFIKILAMYAPKVEVVLLNGNHDHNVSWHLANLLKYLFSESPHVSVDTELVNTKILEYSSNLILLNHGDEMKPKDLATKFPIIAKEKWSQFDNYFVITGDKHHEQAYDYNGIRTYQVPQLSKAKSLWDDKKGHICSKPELVTFLFEEDGLSNILRKEIK